ncbi:MAG: hypothetical protein Fur0022_20770 [Anaerolineales bacterium]
MREDILENIVERMSTDEDFLQKLESKPGKALVEAGLTWEEVAEIKQATTAAPSAEALSERSSAGFTAIGKLWYQLTGNCGCQSSWVPGASTAYVPFCT